METSDLQVKYLETEHCINNVNTGLESEVLLWRKSQQRGKESNKNKKSLTAPGLTQKSDHIPVQVLEQNSITFCLPFIVPKKIHTCYQLENNYLRAQGKVLFYFS